jgi:predicted CoA-binding protein/predicted pyridoxine 5'-phosphate oxidase superfamily flavin-nucleotide-binding protein
MADNADLVFTPAARAEQEARGSAKAYAQRVAEGFPNAVTEELARFIALQDTAFLGTVSGAGAPYIQHRGGPKGFIKVLDERTLGFADFRGNRQYITLGNLAESDRAFLFLLDVARRQRVKLWGRARVVDNDPDLLARLVDVGYKARPDRDPLLGSGHRGGDGDGAADHRRLAAGERPAAGIAGREDRRASEMNHDLPYADGYIRGILNTTKTIAMVGVSPKENRPSYFAFKYLLERGYKMIPVNPGQAGKDLLGQRIYGKLADIPEPIDMVDVFRASPYAMGIVQEALTLDPKPKVIWMQLTVRDDAAAKLAEDNGIKVVMNRCPKIEYGRLSSEISWIGVNSRTLSSKRAKVMGKGVQRMSLNRTTMSGGTTDATDAAQRAQQDEMAQGND